MYVSIVEKHDLLHSSQYGFRQAHSTQHAILDIVESIQINMDKKTFFFIDLKKGLRYCYSQHITR